MLALSHLTSRSATMPQLPPPKREHFQQNTDARAFYERHGFAVLDISDGDRDMENLPEMTHPPTLGEPGRPDEPHGMTGPVAPRWREGRLPQRMSSRTWAWARVGVRGTGRGRR
ncbi:hypothetical protein GCM10010172_79910 [Paractinoplanes ferrugineus]|uniref:Uncharacterized protein n=1 Tax=Paractinoplanes ferrugineus TaxID=113564 RepID=A0A919MHW6_9ACTN|nr:hypothetical protein [Actinoplanes ferrugineus]GIE13065.1 hypothetical protein Afe05nite_49050 [Actinoplanes ferrugineus]